MQWARATKQHNQLPLLLRHKKSQCSYGWRWRRRWGWAPFGPTGIGRTMYHISFAIELVSICLKKKKKKPKKQNKKQVYPCHSLSQALLITNKNPPSFRIVLQNLLFSILQKLIMPWCFFYHKTTQSLPVYLVSNWLLLLLANNMARSLLP